MLELNLSCTSCESLFETYAVLIQLKVKNLLHSEYSLQDVYVRLPLSFYTKLEHGKWLPYIFGDYKEKLVLPGKKFCCDLEHTSV